LTWLRWRLLQVFTPAMDTLAAAALADADALATAAFFSFLLLGLATIQTPPPTMPASSTTAAEKAMILLRRSRRFSSWRSCSIRARRAAAACLEAEPMGCVLKTEVCGHEELKSWC